MANFPSTSLYAPIQLFQRVQSCDYLDSTDGVQHVRIVARSCSESAVVMNAREDEVEDAVSGQCMRLSEKVGCGKAPV